MGKFCCALQPFLVNHTRETYFTIMKREKKMKKKVYSIQQHSSTVAAASATSKYYNEFHMKNFTHTQSGLRVENGGSAGARVRAQFDTAISISLTLLAFNLFLNIFIAFPHLLFIVISTVYPVLHYAFLTYQKKQQNNEK